MRPSIKGSLILPLLIFAFVVSPVMPSSKGTAARRPVRAAHGMAASTHRLASEVGVDVMKRGGNAVDAGVAVAFALAVTHPAAGNIGGGGVFFIRLSNGRT